MVKQSDLFDEFKDYLSGAPVPEIDFLESREAINMKLENRSRIFKASSHKKRLLLAAAIVISLAAYPVYAVTNAIFHEFRTADESISVKFAAETDEFKKMKEEFFANNDYMDEKYQEVIQERLSALKPGETEVIIARSPEGFSNKFLRRVISKDDYINQFDQFMSKLIDAGEYAQFKPIEELPGGFIFDQGEFRYQSDCYMEDDEMEDLMTIAEQNGASYAVKTVKNSDQIQTVHMKYINKTDSDTTVSISVQYNSRDTYFLPEEYAIEKISYNENEVLTYKVPVKNGVLRVYSLLINDLFFNFTFSKDIDNDAAFEIIDAFLH